MAPGRPIHPEGDITRYGVFAQAELMWSDKLTVILGARIDWTDPTPGNALAGGVEVPIPGTRRVKDNGFSSVGGDLFAH